MISWNRTNTLKKVLPNKPGIYKFYDKNRRLLYVGHSGMLRHRIQSYHEVDDPRTHPTKTILRPKIRYYAYETMPMNQARSVERNVKKYARYNIL